MEKVDLGALDIQAILPHRYPFLLVDRITEIEWGTGAVGLKQVSMGEPYFQGHFPEYPVMPGVLIIEALAQVGAVALLGSPEHSDKIALFAGIDGVKFRRQVKPGDTLRLETQITRMRRGVGKGSGVATVDGDVAAQGEITFALVDREALIEG